MRSYIYEVHYSTLIKPDVIYRAYFYRINDLFVFLDIAGDILLNICKVFRYGKTDVTDDFLNKKDV